MTAVGTMPMPRRVRQACDAAGVACLLAGPQPEGRRIAVRIAADGGGAKAQKYADTSKEEGGKQTEVKKKATEFESERDKLLATSRLHEHRHHWLTAAATLLEIGIAICTVAIITRRRAFWLGSLALGAGGVALAAVAFLT